jgi:hypothetical protein
MDTQQLETVWAQTRYDSGLYDCRVVRDGDGGRLTVRLVGSINHLLHEEPVKVDLADTDNWRTRCAAVISNPDLRSCPGLSL